MKSIFCSLVFAIAAASVGLAQSPSISVTLAPIRDSAACTFVATSFTDGFGNSSRPGSQTSGAGKGKLTLSPMTIVKQVDSCSTPLIVAVFTGATIPTVTITVSGKGANGVGPVLTVTLREVVVQSLSDSDSKGEGEPTEKLSVVFSAISICDVAANTCYGGETPI